MTVGTAPGGPARRASTTRPRARGINCFEVLQILFILAMVGALIAVVARAALSRSRRDTALHRARVTKAAAELYQALDCDRASCCPTAQDLVRTRKLDAARTVDPWGTSYRIVCQDDDTVHAVSAGPDRTPRTPDDIRDDSPRSPPPDTDWDAVAQALLGFMATVIAAIGSVGPILDGVRRAVGRERLLVFEALSSGEMVLAVVYAPIVGTVSSALRPGHPWAIAQGAGMAVTSLVVLLLVRLGLGAAWRFRKAFRVRDGAAYRARRGAAAPLRVRSATPSVIEPEGWPVSGTTVYTLEIALTDDTLLTNRYVDEAHRDGDWQALQIPASYRESPGPAPQPA
jgi:hypothetical protein